MDKKPFITIITPTYNRAQLLEAAILSVVNQKKDTPFAWEMIITDDWSKDWTKKYIQKYLDKYSDNIQYFYQENAGVGKARNTCLAHMYQHSDYTIFLDSDDEIRPDLIYTCLQKTEELKKKWEYDSVLGFYFLCEDEDWNIIGNKKILQWKKEMYFDYMSYLRWEINIEMWIWLKSKIFLDDTIKLRFPEDVITETVMWSKMWQYMHKHWMKILLWDYVGRFYRLHHTSEQRICKTISKDRFKKNALWNEQVLDIIWNDLLKFGYKKIYADYLFKIWINWILFHEKKKWLIYLKKSLSYAFRISVFVIYLLASVNLRLLQLIHKFYIKS